MTGVGSSEGCSSSKGVRGVFETKSSRTEVAVADEVCSMGAVPSVPTSDLSSSKGACGVSGAVDAVASFRFSAPATLPRKLLRRFPEVVSAAEDEAVMKMSASCPTAVVFVGDLELPSKSIEDWPFWLGLIWVARPVTADDLMLVLVRKY